MHLQCIFQWHNTNLKKEFTHTNICLPSLITGKEQEIDKGKEGKPQEGVSSFMIDCLHVVEDEWGIRKILKLEENISAPKYIS
jgi:hypothetical protein